jgi:hypothetical protein
MYYQFYLYSGKNFLGEDNSEIFLILAYKIVMPAMVIVIPNGFLSLFFGIEANYINKTMTMPIRFESILRRKYLIACGISFLIFLLLLPILFWGATLPELIAAFLFAIGPLLFLSLWISIFNDKKYELMESALFNWQGITTKHYTISFIALIPIFILLCLARYISENVALGIMAISGVIFVALNRFWISWLAKYYDKNVLNKMEKIE